MFSYDYDGIFEYVYKEYGVSPINYAIGLSVSEAKWLLINTTHSLASISQKA